MQICRVKQIIMTCSVITILALCGISIAADEVVNFSGKDPSEDELIDALTPRAAAHTRGVSLGAGTAAGAAAAPSTMAPQKASFDQITFEINSDRISSKAKALLNKLGHAISSDQLSDVEFIIEGHTDASGGMDYNMRLSKRRAEAVKRYLVEMHQIDADRLKTTGKGPTDLLDKAHPDNGVNRRVVFISVEPK
jgi:OOP family OmpA-OmpF porin